MEEKRTLFIGFELENEYTQISYYHKKSGEPESVIVTSDKSKVTIPTCLLAREKTKEWVFGEEAINERDLGHGVFVEDLLGKLKNQEQVEIFGSMFTAKDLLERYFIKTLGAIKQHCMNHTILKLVVTSKDLTDKMEEDLYEVLKKLGIDSDRVIILNPVQCFMYYAISQRPELWQMDVGLFEFAKKGLLFYHLKINRRTSPITIIVDKIDLSNEFPAGIVKAEDSKRLAAHFSEIAKQVLNRKMISTLYLTGSGFEGDWTYHAVKPICIGRRVFKGQNLYTKGACYAAKALQENIFKDFYLLDDNLVTSTISLKLYTNAKNSEHVLIRAGVPYKKAKKTVTFLLDQTNELEFKVSNLLTQDVMHEVMKLDGMMNRENKTIRLELTIQFLDRNTPIATVRDIGFGEFYKSTMRIWEQELKL